MSDQIATVDLNRLADSTGFLSLEKMQRDQQLRRLSPRVTSILRGPRARAG